MRPLARGLARDIARRAAQGGDLFVGSRPFHDDLLENCLGASGKAAAAARPPETYVEQLRRRFDERYPSADYLAWMSYAALKTGLVEDYLARLDKMGMRESVEGRVPLLDPHLARWAFGLSQEQKIDGYQQKALFRRVVTPLLPDLRYAPSQAGVLSSRRDMDNAADRNAREQWFGAHRKWNRRAQRVSTPPRRPVTKRSIRPLDARHARRVV